MSTTNFRLKCEIEKKNNFNKMTKNQNNKDQIENNNIPYIWIEE
jgi:hypothetical protein